MRRRQALLGISALAASALAPERLALFRRVARAEGREEWRPLALDAKQAALVAELADTILPATDSPGARAARVEVFVDLVLHDCIGPGERSAFLAGLAGFDALCRERLGAGFVEALAEERRALLEEADARAFGPGAGDGGAFFRALKDLVVAGYFVSEIGATRALAYEKVPGRYEGCTELKPDQTAWAT